ncbi:MAG: metal-dependent transcriptional regulator [Chloroflexi bacterium]|nr:metal-dependent transcriptional regulator [Chloroflexota bacterium]
MSNPNTDSLSESEEMYILTILQAGRAGGRDLIPVAEVAEALAVQPVSANQMIRKLQTGGYLDYEPYKGVSLLPRGREAAGRVLRRRRVWLAFLVNELGLGVDAADAFACRLEHITPAAIINRLYDHLGQPAADPLGRPIPPRGRAAPPTVGEPLTGLPLGIPLILAPGEGAASEDDFLSRLGLKPGAPVEILARGGAGLLLQTESGRLEIAPVLAAELRAVLKETPA